MARETRRENVRRDRIRVSAVIAVAAAAGFLVWLLVRDGDGPTLSPATTPTTPATIRTRPLLRPVTPQQLAAFAAQTKHPVYWAGRQPRVKYELTRTIDGKIYVRYLPRGVRIGNRSGQYLLVGTYPVSEAYAAVQRAAKQAGARTFAVRGGGLAVVNDNAPNNVYFAYPHANYQVEVFDPSARRASRLVASGTVRPVR